MSQAIQALAAKFIADLEAVAKEMAFEAVRDALEKGAGPRPQMKTMASLVVAPPAQKKAIASAKPGPRGKARAASVAPKSPAGRWEMTAAPAMQASSPVATDSFSVGDLVGSLKQHVLAENGVICINPKATWRVDDRRGRGEIRIRIERSWIEPASAPCDCGRPKAPSEFWADGGYFGVLKPAY